MKRTVKSFFFIILSVILITTSFSFGVSASKTTVGTVTELKANVTTNSVTLNWKKADKAKGYKVMEKVKGKWKTKSITTSTTCIINELSPGSLHTYAIKAYTRKNGKKVWSKKYKTITVLTKPEKIKGLSATLNENCVTLKWKKAKGATEYRVYRYNDTSKKWTNIKTTKKLKTTIKNLKYGKTYKFAVKAYCKKSKITKLSPSYTKITVTVTANKVTNLSATKISSDSVTLSWEKVTNAKSYRVYKYNSKTKKWETVINGTKSPVAIISELTPDTKYTFGVKAVKKVNGKTVLSNKYTKISVTTLLIPVTTTVPSTSAVHTIDVTNTPPTTTNNKGEAVNLIVNSYGCGDGVIYVEVDPSNWEGNFVAQSQNINIKVDGSTISSSVTCKVPSKKTGGSYEIKIDLSSQDIPSGSLIEFTIPTGIIKNESGTQYNTSYSASVTV